ncbi:trypsin-like cysteine/serine peptidase domain-containing protein, partial [Dimargaris cristalligena]
IMTAAHCVVDCPDSFDSLKLCSINKAGLTHVTIGTADPRTVTNYNISQVVAHPDYYMEDVPVNDIALIKLETPLVYSAKIQPIKIYTGTIKDNDSSRVIGWGKTQENQKSANPAPYEVDLALSNDREACDLIDGLDFKDSNGPYICSAKNDFKGTCQGDSGGPL